MKRLILLGEGHGETSALPILVRRLIRERESAAPVAIHGDAIRNSNPIALVKWLKDQKRPDYTNWLKRIQLAAKYASGGAVLAVADGDAPHFPAGSNLRFCAATAAKSIGAAAKQAGAGTIFSLAIVFACKEYESWLVAGAESFMGKSFPDERPILKAKATFPGSEHELRGKGWLEQNCESYRPARDQAALTEMVDLALIRSKRLRSFVRLEHAVDELLNAVTSGKHVCTPF